MSPLLAQDHATGPGDRAGDGEHGPPLDEHGGDSGSATAGERFDRAPAGALAHGAANRPMQDRTWNERGGSGAETRPCSIDEPADSAAGQPQRAGDLFMAGPV